MDNDFLLHVLITGADKGLGLSLAARFLHAGWQTFAGIYQDSHNLKANEFAYCMSKAALDMQLCILHNVLAEGGFQVMAIHPGWMRTDMGGPEADIHPDEAAEGIFVLALKPRLAGELMIINYQGNPLPW